MALRSKVCLSVPYKGVKVLGCTCALGSVLLCVHSWKIQIDKTSVDAVVAAGSVRKAQLAQSLNS